VLLIRGENVVALGEIVSRSHIPCGWKYALGPETIYTWKRRFSELSLQLP